jgi:hypothetical protein
MATQPQDAALEAALAPGLGLGMPFGAPDLAGAAQTLGAPDLAGAQLSDLAGGRIEPSFKPARAASRLHHVREYPQAETLRTCLHVLHEMRK